MSVYEDDSCKIDFQKVFFCKLDAVQIENVSGWMVKSKKQTHAWQILAYTSVQNLKMHAFVVAYEIFVYGIIFGMIVVHACLAPFPTCGKKHSSAQEWWVRSLAGGTKGNNFEKKLIRMWNLIDLKQNSNDSDEKWYCFHVSAEELQSFGREALIRNVARILTVR